MNRKFWKVARKKLTRRLTNHNEFCDPDCEVCDALTIIMEDTFLAKAEKRYSISPCWRGVLLKILDEIFGDDVTNENILSVMHLLSNWGEEDFDSEYQWTLLILYYGGYSTRIIGQHFGVHESLVWKDICQISERMKTTLNPN